MWTARRPADCASRKSTEALAVSEVHELRLAFRRGHFVLAEFVAILAGQGCTGWSGSSPAICSGKSAGGFQRLAHGILRDDDTHLVKLGKQFFGMTQRSASKVASPAESALSTGGHRVIHLENRAGRHQVEELHSRQLRSDEIRRAGNVGATEQPSLGSPPAGPTGCKWGRQPPGKIGPLSGLPSLSFSFLRWRLPTRRRNCCGMNLRCGLGPSLLGVKSPLSSSVPTNSLSSSPKEA